MGQLTPTDASEERSPDGLASVTWLVVRAELMVVPWLETEVASIMEAVAMMAVMEVEKCILLSFDGCVCYWCLLIEGP